MRTLGSKELFQYWNRLRDGRPAPLRTQIEPVDIRAYLADTFILEQGHMREVTFRLAGTRVCSIFGRELKNYSFLSLFSLADMSLIKRLVNACFVEKTVSVVTLDGFTRDRRIARLELILLPLESNADGVRLFGAVFAEETPFWLGATPIVDSRITSVRIVDADKDFAHLAARPSIVVPPLEPADRHISNLGESPEQAGHGARKVAHLRVINGGKSEEPLIH